MKLTPIDITHKTFTRKMFGYDQAEVGEFLDQIAQSLEELVHERNLMREQLREKELQIQDFKERDSVLKSTIATASQMAERMRQDGEREAKLITSDAQQKADMILRDARDSLKRMYQEVADMKRMRLQFEANMRAMAQAHMSLLDQGDKYMPAMGLPNAQMEGEAHTQAAMPAMSAPTSMIPNAAPAAQTTAVRSPRISPLTAG